MELSTTMDAKFLLATNNKWLGWCVRRGHTLLSRPRWRGAAGSAPFAALFSLPHTRLTRSREGEQHAAHRITSLSLSLSARRTRLASLGQLRIY